MATIASFLLAGGRLILKTALTQIAGEPTLLTQIAIKIAKSEKIDFDTQTPDVQRRWLRLAQESVLALRELVS